jgi:hypothetical protein
VKGGDLKNVFYIIKDYGYLKEAVDVVRASSDVVVLS